MGTPPLVVVPGIQGRWEWMRPALEALQQTHDVRTFSLTMENGVGDPFDQWLAEIDRAIASSGSAQAVLVGVSFGGLIATLYAATHPDRVAALILVSSPSPHMVLGRAEEAMLKRPLVLLPLFAVRGLRRLLPEVIAAHDSWPARLSFLIRYAWQITLRPMSPTQTARWVRAWKARDLSAACAQVQAPTHIITGEPSLDRVVSTASTREYLTLIPGATSVTLPRTGHIGLVSRPAAFAALVNAFLHDLHDSGTRRPA